MSDGSVVPTRSTIRQHLSNTVSSLFLYALLSLSFLFLFSCSNSFTYNFVVVRWPVVCAVPCVKVYAVYLYSERRVSTFSWFVFCLFIFSWFFLTMKWCNVRVVCAMRGPAVMHLISSFVLSYFFCRSFVWLERFTPSLFLTWPKRKTETTRENWHSPVAFEMGGHCDGTSVWLTCPSQEP